MIRIIFLTLLIFSSTVLTQHKELAVEDIFTKKEFYGESLSGVKWLGNGKKFSFLGYDDESRTRSIYLHDVETGKEEILIKGSSLILTDNTNSTDGEIQQNLLLIRNYYWSPDENYILFTGVLPARTVKSGGDFIVYSLNERKIILSVISEEPQVNIKFSPDSKKIGFVRNNNLFTIDIKTKKETQLTFDGSDVILNGVFDWVYEEEFSIIEGWEWSSDNRNIAFWRLDQSKVPEFNIINWDSLYPQVTTMRYPKPGFPNSLVNIGVVDINTQKTTWMDIGSETDIYIPRIKFTGNPKLLSIQKLNRLQNKLDLLFADISTGNSKLILSESDSAWVEVYDDLHFLKGKNQFVWSSDRDNFHHLYLFDYEGNLIKQITKGDWEVIKLASVDAENQKIYYISNEGGVIYTNLFCINFDGSGKRKITPEKGEHKIDYSPSNNYFIDYYSNPAQLKITSLRDSEGNLIRNLKVPDMSFYEEYNLSAPEFFSFTTSDGVELNAEIIKPINFDESQKYPVLIYAYGGPGSQLVEYSWGGSDYLWHQLLNQKGYIIFMLDNRGTGGRGKKFQTTVYKNLGYWEVNDMVEGAKYLASLPFVDEDRIGIWGWSYGGYLSSLSLMKAADYFKTAIAVAPVTHWKFYDTIYSERFMQTPALNPEGYENSAPINFADKLKGNLLLVHGTGDDNVHFQNSVELMNKLIEENKQFRTMFYPGRDHSISTMNSLIHLYKLMTEYILENL